MNRAQVLAWERRWSLPTTLATFATIACLIAAAIVVSSLNSGGEAASLRDLHSHGSTVTIASVLQGVAFLLLALPLFYLFRVVSARSDRMRTQLLPLILLAPLALGFGSVLNGVAAGNAASDFVAGKATASLSKGEATRKCRSEQKEDAAGFRGEFGAGASGLSHCASTKIADDEAQNAIDNASGHRFSEAVQLVGVLALAFGLGYCCFNGMRVGLFTRFWGSLGIALGVAAILGLFQFTMIWFLYFALLVSGWVPRGRPPAWAAGKAIPWPTPGEQAAAKLEPENLKDLEKPADEEQSR